MFTAQLLSNRVSDMILKDIFIAFSERCWLVAKSKLINTFQNRLLSCLINWAGLSGYSGLGHGSEAGAKSPPPPPTSPK